MRKYFIKQSVLTITLTIALFFITGNSAAQQTNKAVRDNSANHAPGKEKVVQGALAEKVDDYLNRSVPFGFSGAMMVAQNDKLILLNGYGLANRERRIPVTVDSVFYIGSVTKQFTASAILKLEMQGKLLVTDTLDKHFKDVPADKKGITIHQLLTQSSGLGNTEDKYGSPVQKDAHLRRIMEVELDFEPGKKYSYSNAGYTLLGIIVENVSGQPYERYLHDNLFKPAGMLSTGYRIPNWTLDNVAHGYSAGLDKGSPLERPWLEDGPSWALRGAGGMLSTLGDLYRWHLALNKDEILSAEAKRKMFSPHVKMADNVFYGYGWTVQKTPRGTTLIEHNGSDGIFFADFRRYVDESTVIIGVTNDIYSVAHIESKVPDIFFGSNNIKFPPQTSAKAIPGAVLQKYTGTYQLTSGAIVRVILKENRLILDPIGQEAVNLLTNIQPSETENLEKLNLKVKEILDEAIKGDFSMLKASIAPEKFEGFKSFITELLELSEEKKPSPVKYEVIGSHPLWFAAGQPLTTFVRLSDNKDPAGLLFVTWENNRIRGRGATRESDDTTIRTPFIASSKKSFAGFHAGLEKSVSISFKTKQRGEAVAIEFQTDQGIRTAKRVNVP